MDLFREYYLRMALSLGTELLEKKLAEAVEFAKRGHGYSIMPWEEVKMEIDAELGRRALSTEQSFDLAGHIWRSRGG